MPILDRSSAPQPRPSGCVCNPAVRCYPPIIATPVPEGPLTNDQVNHIIERLQCIIHNNGGGPSPNRGATRQLRPVTLAVGPACHHPTPTGQFPRHWRWIHVQRRRPYGHCGMYPPPPLLGGAKDMTTTVVDTVGTLRRATEAV